MTSSNGNIFRVTGHLCGEITGPCESPTQRPVTRSFDVFFDLRLKKRLSKQWWGWCFETISCSLRRHRNGMNTMKPGQIDCYLQTIYSKAFSWKIGFNIDWNVIVSVGSGNSTAPLWPQARISDNPGHRLKDASPSWSELSLFWLCTQNWRLHQGATISIVIQRTTEIPPLDRSNIILKWRNNERYGVSNHRRLDG